MSEQANTETIPPKAGGVMSPEAQRIAIAEACGYKNIHKDRHGYLIGDGKPDHQGIPDYLNDLNAMHEAEKVLTWSQGMHYRLLLARNSDGPKAAFRTVEAAMCHATAAQRAKAFALILSYRK